MHYRLKRFDIYTYQSRHRANSNLGIPENCKLLYLSVLLSMYHHELLRPILFELLFDFHLRMTYYKQTMNTKVPKYNQLDYCLEY